MSVLRKLYDILAEDEESGLSGRMSTGAVWSFLLNASQRLLSLTKVTVVAAFLPPEEFGVFGIAVLTLAALKAFTYTGFERALIQRDTDDIDHLLDTAWTAEVARGVLVAVVGFLGAPLVSQFFGEPAAVPVLRALALTAVIRSLQNPAVVYFDKDLVFSKKFRLEVPPAAAGAVAAVGLAALTGSIWALVAGNFAVAITKIPLSYLQDPYRPSFKLDVEKFRELISFGGWITLTSILSFLITTADDVFVGRYFDAAVLGVYQLGFRLANAPATEITDTVNSVTRPGYAETQSDAETLRRVFLNTVRVVYLLVFPMAAGIFLVAGPFVRTLYSDQWLGLVPIMQAFAGVALIRAAGSVFGPVLEALGNPDYNAKNQFVGTVAMIAAFVPLSEAFGPVGTALATGVRFLVMIPVILYLVERTTPISVVAVGRVTGQPVLATVGMVGVVLLFQRQASSLPSVLVLCGSVVVGVVSYAALVFVTDYVFGYETIDRLVSS